MEIETRQTHVLWAKKTELVSGIAHKKSIHSFYHLLYVLSGSGTFICNGEARQISPDSCVLVPPYTVHVLPSEGHALMSFFEVKFEVQSPYINEHLLQLNPFLDGTPFMKTALSYIVTNWMREEKHSQKNVDTLLTAMLLTLFLDRVPQKADTSLYLNTENYNDLTKKIVNYIEMNYDDQFHLQELGEYLKLNKNYLCSVFKENTGHTIIEYLNYVRIRAVLSMLYYGENIMLSTAALYVGFTNPTHFNRTFSALTGVTPTVMRVFFESELSDASKFITDSDTTFIQKIGLKVTSLDKAFEALQELGASAKEYYLQLGNTKPRNPNPPSA